MDGTRKRADVTGSVRARRRARRIAADHAVSPHTVRTVSIFEKTGVAQPASWWAGCSSPTTSRRLRDNERRVRDGRPIRGGPVPGDAA